MYIKIVFPLITNFLCFESRNEQGHKYKNTWPSGWNLEVQADFSSHPGATTFTTLCDFKGYGNTL